MTKNVHEEKKTFKSFRTRKYICSIGQEKLHVLEDMKNGMSFNTRKHKCP